MQLLHSFLFIHFLCPLNLFTKPSHYNTFNKGTQQSFRKNSAEIRQNSEGGSQQFLRPGNTSLHRRTAVTCLIRAHHRPEWKPRQEIRFHCHHSKKREMGQWILGLAALFSSDKSLTLFSVLSQCTIIFHMTMKFITFLILFELTSPVGSKTVEHFTKPLTPTQKVGYSYLTRSRLVVWLYVSGTMCSFLGLPDLLHSSMSH